MLLLGLVCFYIWQTSAVDIFVLLQARYRERQKEKFSDYKTAVEELSQQLENLSAEKDALAADKAMLESCLQVSYQKGLTASQSHSAALPTVSAEAYQVTNILQPRIVCCCCLLLEIVQFVQKGRPPRQAGPGN